MKVRFLLTMMAAFAVSGATVAASPISKTERIVRKINRKCGLRAGVLSAVNDEIHLAPSPTDKYDKVNCALAALQKADVPKMGFVGNAIDPNAVLDEPYRYIAEGTEEQISSLSQAVIAEGWLMTSRVRGEGDTSFLLFQTRAGETFGGSEKLTKRIWNEEFGDIAFGRAPSKLSDRSDEQ